MHHRGQCFCPERKAILRVCSVEQDSPHWVPSTSSDIVTAFVTHTSGKCLPHNFVISSNTYPLTTGYGWQLTPSNAVCEEDRALPFRKEKTARGFGSPPRSNTLVSVQEKPRFYHRAEVWVALWVSSLHTKNDIMIISLHNMLSREALLDPCYRWRNYRHGEVIFPIQGHPKCQGWKWGQEPKTMG